MFARNSFRCASWAATAVLALLTVPMMAQPQPAPQPPAPPEPPRGMKVMTFGGPVSYLGIGVKEILAERAKELKLKEEAGIEVTRVDTGSPAEKAGLKNGDVVLEYQGARVEGVEQFVRLVRETPIGRQAKLKIFRAGSSQTLMATIGERPANAFGMSPKDRERLEQEMGRMRERMRNMPDAMPPDVPRPYMGWRSGMIGIEAEALESQLAEFFGVKEGVLVRGVAKDLPAAKAGIKAGDVIIRVDDTKVASPRDITKAIRTARNSKAIKVTLIRQKAEMTFELQVDEEKQPSPRGMTIGHPKENEF